MAQVSLQSQPNIRGAKSGSPDHAFNDVAVVAEDTSGRVGSVAVVKPHRCLGAKFSLADSATGTLQVKQPVGDLLSEASSHEALVGHLLRPLFRRLFERCMSIRMEGGILEPSPFKGFSVAVSDKSLRLDVWARGVFAGLCVQFLSVILPALAMVGKVSSPFFRGAISLLFLGRSGYDFQCKTSALGERSPRILMRAYAACKPQTPLLV